MEQDTDLCERRVVNLCFKCEGPQGGGRRGGFRVVLVVCFAKACNLGTHINAVLCSLVL